MVQMKQVFSQRLSIVDDICVLYSKMTPKIRFVHLIFYNNCLTCMVTEQKPGYYLQQLLTAVVFIWVIYTVRCPITVPVPLYTLTCPTAELPQFTPCTHSVFYQYTFLKLLIDNNNVKSQQRGGWDRSSLGKHAINRNDIHWRRACQPSPPRDSCTTLSALFPNLLLMFSQSGICRDKVAPLYLPWRFPGKIESSSIVQRQSTPSGPIKQECAFLMVSLAVWLMEHAGSVLMCNWNK